jgi:hypothetical protein
LLDYMTGNGKQFDWSVDPNITSEANYNTNGSIVIKNPSSTGIQSLFEELTHAYQNFNTSGGLPNMLILLILMEQLLILRDRLI